MSEDNDTIDVRHLSGWAPLIPVADRAEARLREVTDDPR